MSTLQSLDSKTLSRLENAVSKSQYVGQGKKLKVTNKVNTPSPLLDTPRSSLPYQQKLTHARSIPTSSVDSSSRSATAQSTSRSPPASPR